MYHLHVRKLSRGARRGAADQIDYISRAGRYARRGDQVRWVRSWHMPRWAEGSHRTFWEALDQEPMRANARLLYSIEFSVPRGLGVDAQNLLVDRFVRLVARRSVGADRRGTLPALAAFHEGCNADDERSGRQPNPHVHLKLATVINDGVARSRENWFRRANSKRPELGGAPRSAFLGSRGWLLWVREVWARLANKALRRAGLEAALDHRSYRDRGVALQPTKHLGPRETLSLRAGRPGPKARRNERIRRLNARLAELERQRRLNAERQASAMRAEDAQLFVLREDLRRARRRLRDALASSPMAGDHDALRTSSALFVEGVPVADTAFPDGRRALDQVRTRLRAMLGDGWLDVRVRDRLFMLRPGHDEVIVVGLGWLATDSVEPGTGRLVADLVHELGLKDLMGFAAENQQELRDGVDAALRERGESCAWSERHASLHSSALPR